MVALFSFSFLLFVFLVLVLLFTCICVSSVSLPGDDVLCWLLYCPLSSVCFPCFSPDVFPVWFDFVWFRLSCDHGWICSGSVNVR